jgi:hypothetical protein
MTRIPGLLKDAFLGAFPREVCLVGTQLPDGRTQISPRGSAMVYDDTHMALWERGHGSTNAGLAPGTKITFFLRRQDLRTVLPKGGVVRLFGTVAAIHKSGPVYDEVWRQLIQPEKDRDAQRMGYAVLTRIDTIEDLEGEPVKLD